MAKNVIIKTQESCVTCPHYDYYYPTSDSFDMDHVGYCTHKDVDKNNNEMGYGRRDDEFPIPDWCPILLEQQKTLNK